MKKRHRVQHLHPPEASKPGRVSGKAAAFWMVLCLLVTALLIPMALRLPTWIEFEIVLVLWWAIWIHVLTVLLYFGLRITNDFVLRNPRSWISLNRESQGKGVEGDLHWPVTTDPEGCLVAIFLLLALWLLFEFALPAVIFIVYVVARGMLAHVANDRHRCRRQLLRSLMWASIWATVYTLPLILAVWLFHDTRTR